MQLAWEEATFVHLIVIKGWIRSYSFRKKNSNDLYKNWQMDSNDRFSKFADEGIRVKYIHYADGG